MYKSESVGGVWNDRKQCWVGKRLNFHVLDSALIFMFWIV